MPEPWSKRINTLKRDGLLRELHDGDGPSGRYFQQGKRKYLNFCSNNQLGLANHPLVKQAVIKAIGKWGVGSGAARLLGGGLSPHHKLEKKLAAHCGMKKALLFGTGYAGNLGALSAIGSYFDKIYCDRLCHGSLLDGALSSGTSWSRYPHLNLDNLEEQLNKNKSSRVLIVTETLFSMDGDFADLDGLSQLQKKYGCTLYLDGAHSIGAYPEIYRAIKKMDPERTLVFGTLGKALGVFGAYIAASEDWIQVLVNSARTFLFSTALPPALAEGASAALDICLHDKSRIQQLKKYCHYFEKGLRTLGIPTQPQRVSHIFPIQLGSNQRVLKAQKDLQKKGIWALPVRHPTVPKGTERLRISLSSELKKDDLDSLLDAIPGLMDSQSS